MALLTVVAISCLSIGWPAVAADSSGNAGNDDGEKVSTPMSWYTSALVSGRSGYRVTHYWSLGPALRSQTIIGVRPMTTIVYGDRYWVYDELLAEGIEIKRSPLAIAEDAKRGRPFGRDLEIIVEIGGERIETALVSGIPAETWRVTNSMGRRTVWVTANEPKVPLRVENFIRESGESATLNYSNWASGFEIQKKFFSPPADLELRRFEYNDFVAESLKGPIGHTPILYPELIHGSRPQ